MSSGGVNIRINKPTHRRVVISALEVVERGLSVLGLTAMPDYALDTHTKPHRFRVGILRRYIDLQLTDKLPNVEIGAIGQHVTNGVAGTGLAFVSGRKIVPCRITVGIAGTTLHGTTCVSIVGNLLLLMVLPISPLVWVHASPVA